ncbi:MAG: YidC/Oxa1 family membrane protein insertase [Clostridium sp.]
MEGLINIFYGFTGDLGVSIIGVTVLVKLILLPLSINGKKSGLIQKELSQKMDDVKRRFKKNKSRMEKELQALQKESVQSMKGCLLQFIQIPIISFMYMGVSNIQIEAATALIPWVKSIKLSDQFFIIPIIYVVVSLLPALISKVRGEESAINPAMNIVMCILSLVITIKAPIGLGIYFITSSLFSLIEGEVFNFIYNRKLKVITK